MLKDAAALFNDKKERREIARTGIALSHTNTPDNINKYK